MNNKLTDKQKELVRKLIEITGKADAALKNGANRYVVDGYEKEEWDLQRELGLRK